MPKTSPTRCTAPCAATNHATKRNTTQTGDYSEAAFLLKATSLGFGVAKPWSNSERYDFILDNGSRLWRVQVKCTASLRARGYDVQPIRAVYLRGISGKSKLAYTPDDVDALVAHIVPVDVWYVLPIAACAHKSLRFYPGTDCPQARFEKYREAWGLFAPHQEQQISSGKARSE